MVFQLDVLQREKYQKKMGKKNVERKMEAGAPSVCLTVSPLPPLASPLILNKQQLRLSATGPTVCPDKNDNKGRRGGKKTKKQTKREKKITATTAGRDNLDPKTLTVPSQTGFFVATLSAL